MSQPTTPAPPPPTPLLDGDRAGPLYRAVTWALDTRLFDHLPRHGNTRWAAPDLVLLALFWVWSECPTLTGAFAQARACAARALGAVALTTYQGFAGALTTWTGRLLPVLWAGFQRRMAEVAGGHWRIGGWLPLAVDGTRATAPRTRANERALGPPAFGRGRTARSRKKWKNKRRRSKRLAHPAHPQVWLTLLWHVGLRMPWAWKCGPSTASERDHLADLVGALEFPDKTLFCGDAGFVGYDLWRALAGRGHHFLVRVGSNVRLLRRLGAVRRRGDLYHVWPKAAMAAGRPPLTVRLLAFRSGRGEMYAVTNVLAPRALTDAQARRVYRARWGVEVQFRSLKQTFGRGKLHSRTPDRAVAELEWSLLGLWLVQLLAAAEQIPAGTGPDRTSVSLGVQLVRSAMRGDVTGCLRRGFRAAVRDPYRRRGPRAGRYRPRAKDKPSAGRPVITAPSPEQNRKYRLLREVE